MSFQIPVLSVIQNKLGARSTGTTVGAGGVAMSTAVASYSNSTASYTTVASITITTTGRPVFIGLTSSAANIGTISITGTGTQSVGIFTLFSGVTTIGGFSFGTSTGSAGNCACTVPPSSIFYIDGVVAGTYTYTLSGKIQSLTFPGTISASNVQLVAYEL